MDTVKLAFVCQQCGQRVTLTLRQTHAGRRPACRKCGPAARFTFLERIPQHRNRQA